LTLNYDEFRVCTQHHLEKLKVVLGLRRLRYIGNKSGMIESSNQINENEVADESI